MTLASSMWLFDVRELVDPSAQLCGFDISFDAAPPREILPSNVSFRHWDVKQDLPEDLVESFDIVHVRFFAFVLMSDQVQPVVERLFKMLSTSACHRYWERFANKTSIKSLEATFSGVTQTSQLSALIQRSLAPARRQWSN